MQMMFGGFILPLDESNYLLSIAFNFQNNLFILIDLYIFPCLLLRRTVLN